MTVADGVGAGLEAKPGAATLTRIEEKEGDYNRKCQKVLEKPIQYRYI